MSQWGQPQQGFQYPMQTGFPAGNQQFQQNPQFQPQNAPIGQQQPQFQQPQGGFQQGGFGGQPGVLQPQTTGFAMQRTGFQQAQPTGFPGGQSMLQAQPTGYVGGNFGQQGRPPPPPVPPLPQQFQQQNQGGGMMGLQQPQQPNRFLTTSPGLGAPNLLPQPTGFAGRTAPLVPQATGFVDPRLQMLSQTFMPINTSAPYTPGGLPQLAPQQNLQQSFQQYNQDQRGSTTQQLSWALSKTEKKNYDKIFRSWDTSGTGFINGSNALEVFGQCGLPQNELAKIWSLADIDDRGKLNVAEFHVAMGLIYRRLNGNPIPDVLPSELIPPSARDLDSSVDFLKDVLKHEQRSRSPLGVDSPVSRIKSRTLNSSGGPAFQGRDATIYKHSDLEPPGGFYKPRSRHVDRDAVRRTDDDSPSSDLSDMKRQLANTAHALDRDAEAHASRSKEEQELEQEMADLKYRVRRVQEDINYIQHGPRSSAKDEEKRKLERELLTLMHERIPEVERKAKAIEERKERERRDWARTRDRTNERHGRFDPKEDSYSSRRYDDDRGYDRPSSRNYDRDTRYRRSRSRSGSRERRDRSRDRDRDYDRPRSPPARSVPSPPPSSLRVDSSRSTPKPARSPAPDLKNMTPEQRRAHAQRLIQERRVALGLDVPPSTTTVDTSIEDRLQQEKKEAGEKAKAQERDREERERARNERLEREKAPAPTPTIAVSPPAPAPAVRTPAPPAPTPKVAPAPPKARTAPPPPPIRSRAAPPKPPAVVAAPPPPEPAPPAPAVPEVDNEEEQLRAKLRKQREEKLERLRKQIEEEEAEDARLEEERLLARRQALKQKQSRAPSPPPVAVAPPAPPAPPIQAPPAATSFSAPTSAVAAPGKSAEKSTNPFSRMMKEQGAPVIASSPSAPPTSLTNGGHNPWAARPQTAPPPSKSPTPAAIKTSYNTAPASHTDDDWDDVKEKDDDDDSSDEDEIDRSRSARTNIAQQLFGSILPRPQSAAAVTNGRSTPSSPAPAGGSFSASPPAPPPPPILSAPVAPPPPQGAPLSRPPVGNSALMASIQGGLKLRPTKTVDKSGPAFSGKVLGDSTPPAHINAVPRPASPPQISSSPQQEYNTLASFAEPPQPTSSKADNRQSVAWMSNRAASDVGIAPVSHLSSMEEAEEEDYSHVAAPVQPIPAIQVDEPVVDAATDLMSDIDKSTQHDVRSLYAYEGEGPDDLSFNENVVLTANPSKTGGDWWFGTTVQGGKSGLFPKTYVEVVHPVKAKALYDYAPGNPDELSLSEGQIVTIIDKSEEEWWKAERDGLVLVVPAPYLELVEG